MASKSGYCYFKELFFKSLYRRGLNKTGQNVLRSRGTANSTKHQLELEGKAFSTSSCDTTARLFRALFSQLNEHLNVLASLFAKQCNVIAAQRLRRAVQIMQLYNRLGYDRQTLRKVVEKFSGNLKYRKSQPLYALFGACVFSWDRYAIKEDELKERVNELQYMKAHNPGFLPREIELLGDMWEKVVDHEKLVVWRRPLANSYLYEYKVYGTFYDIPARAFYDVQVDLDYRKQWDKLIIQLDMVDKDEASGCEIIRWVTHYPFPMYSREYVFVRKCMVDTKSNVMLTISHAVDHPKCPVQTKYVRVDTYESNLVIKPHTKFDEVGFDYMLTYCDDPQAAIPTPAYNWMASTGVPDFLNKVHKAAMELQDLKQAPQPTSDGNGRPMTH